MADKNVSIKFSADTKNAEKGIKNVKKDLGDLGTSKTSKGLSNIGNIFTGITSAVGLAKSAIEGVAIALNECNEAYKAQEKAEVQLETAAKNNPYLDATSVQNLKNYASELQNIGTIGDEELMPLMAKLASSGRTQTQIQEIMTTALDMSASGVMSMESAVDNLNKSFNGSAGELGELIPELSTLTEEELRQGKAIAVVAKSYKGMAEQVARATGSTQQLSNTWGDFKEIIGRGINNVVTPVENAVNNIISKINTAMTKAKTLEDNAKAVVDDAGLGAYSDDKWVDYSERAKAEVNAITEEEQRIANVAEASVRLGRKMTEEWMAQFNKTAKQMDVIGEQTASNFQRQWNLRSATDTFDTVAERVLKVMSKLSGFEDLTLDAVKGFALQNEVVNVALAGIVTETEKAVNLEREKTVEKKKQAEIDAENAEQLKKQKEANDSASASYKQYEETIKAKEKEIFARKQAGEEITVEAEQQEMLNTKISAYLTLMQNPNISGTQGRAKEIADEIARETIEQNKYNKTLEKLESLTKDITPQIDEMLNPDDDSKLSDSIQVVIDTLEVEAEKLKDNTELYDQYITKISELKTSLEQVQEIESDENVKNFLELLSSSGESELTEAEKIAKEIKDIETEYAKLSAEEKEETQEDYLKKLKELNEEYQNAINDDDAKKKQEQLDAMEKMATQYASIVQGMADVVGEAYDLMLTKIETEADLEKAELEEKYANGEMSYEEYQEKLEDIDEETARKKYKIDMANWAMNLATATANIAVGATQAIASGGAILGPVLAGLVTAAGAIQIASIIASKPVPPSFATGGIVQGKSYTGDKVQANVNSGEMILNAQQQKTLWEVANGKGGANGIPNIIINNNASNVVTSQAQTDTNAINILIDARVNESMRKGKYNTALRTANSSMSGNFYGS